MRYACEEELDIFDTVWTKHKAAGIKLTEKSKIFNSYPGYYHKNVEMELLQDSEFT